MLTLRVNSGAVAAHTGLSIGVCHKALSFILLFVFNMIELTELKTLFYEHYNALRKDM